MDNTEAVLFKKINQAMFRGKKTIKHDDKVYRFNDELQTIVNQNKWFLRILNVGLVLLALFLGTLENRWLSFPGFVGILVFYVFYYYSLRRKFPNNLKKYLIEEK